MALVETELRGGNGASLRSTSSEPSLGELFSDLARQTGTLVKKEIELARVEMTDKAIDAGKKAAMVAGGGVVCAVSGLLFLAALVFGLAEFMPLWLSALLVGVLVAIVGTVFVLYGVRALKKFDPVPRQTIETVKETKLWAEQQMAR